MHALVTLYVASSDDLPVCVYVCLSQSLGHSDVPDDQKLNLGKLLLDGTYHVLL